MEEGGGAAVGGREVPDEDEGAAGGAADRGAGPGGRRGVLVCLRGAQDHGPAGGER